MSFQSIILFSAISRQAQVTFRLDDVCLVLDQHAYLDFYSASSLKQIHSMG